MSPLPPPTRAEDLVEELHGHRVADPYRWLEDADSPEVRAWVEAQRAHADQVLASLPHRDWFASVMESVTSRPRASAPRHSHGLYLQSRNDGTQNQDVLYAADSLEELLQGGRVLVDPNQWSEDGSVSLAFASVNPRGDLVAVGRNVAGSDWTVVGVVDAEGNPVDDVEVVTKFCRAVWLPDGDGYLYNAFPGAGRAEGTETRALPACHVMVHRVGDDPNQDVEVADFEADPEVIPWAETSDDDAWLVLHLNRGTERSNRVRLHPLHEQGARTAIGAGIDVVDQPTAAWYYVGTARGELLFQTDDDAEMGRVVALDPATWTLSEVVAEGSMPIESTVLAGDVLVLSRLVDASPRLERFSLDGELLGIHELPGGAVEELSASPDSGEVFYQLSTIVDPSQAWRLDASTGQCELLPGPSQGWQAPAFSVQRHTATSADGTSVPYFLVVPEGSDPGRPRPTMLYGYGGFDVPVLADHRATWPGWLAAGGVLAIANLRGGGEFGRSWYQDGIRENKQHVFDDVIAVAEDLVSTGVTTSGQLALHGKSNGGLLVGAAITQRPELFAAALPHVGVLDCVRFHRFTVGAAWKSDYGDPEVAEDLERILGWSPLHNVRPGTCYPATLVLTSDHDDRVVPAHSFKFTAALQAAQGGEAPVLARIEAATGHGLANKPPAVLAAECTDLLAFAAHHTGLEPKAPVRVGS